MNDRSLPILDLPVVLLVAIALQLPMLDPRIVPTHDTFYCFANFYVFYGEFFFEHALAHWLPYGAYGMPAALQQVISLGPLDYVAGCIGALLRIHDALLLFKLARIGEVMLFSFGIWMLTRRLVADRATAIGLGIAAAGTSVWYAQLWFDLRFYYLLPLVLYCAHRFLVESKPTWLWLAGVTSVAWSMGNVPYFVPMWGFALFCILIPPALRHRAGWARLLKPSRTDLLCLLLFAASATIFVYVAFDALDFLVIREEGRDALTRKVGVETFRSYGGNAQLSALARSFLLGSPVHLPWGKGRDNSAYIGLLPLAGLVLAIARERSAFFVGLLLASGLLVWLSLGGRFSALVYQLPLLSEYRHIGLVYGIVKTCMILAAGYGIERLLRHRPSEPRRVGIALIGLGLVLAGVAAWVDSNAPFLLRLSLYAALTGLSLGLRASLQAGVLIALVLDLAIYQGQVREAVPGLPAGVAVGGAVFDASPLAYQPMRLERPAAGTRAAQALEVAKRDASSTTAWNAHAFAQFDPCTYSDVNADTFTYGVDTLLRLGSEGGADIRYFLGCTAPKLRLVSSARVVQRLPKALELLGSTSGEASAAPDVIRLPPKQRAPVQAAVADTDPGRVQVTRFTANELVAQARVSPPGAWLLYADAYHPRWSASVDGRESFIAEANLAFKAVWVAAGDHVVRFEYGPRRASEALALFGLSSGVGSLGWIGAACLGSRRAPRP